MKNVPRKCQTRVLLARDILVKINAAYATALQDPDLLRRIADSGSFVPKADVDGATALARKEYAAWFESAMAAGVREK